jgi:hypothetical protein
MIRRWAAAAAVTLTLAACAHTDPNASAEPRRGTDLDAVEVSPQLAAKLAQARAATAKYVNDLSAAEAAGYHVITRMMPGMGYHYMNPGIKGFDVSQPAILSYVNNGDRRQLAALVWAWPEQPASAPLDNATYGTFEAGCHYQNGIFVPATAGPDCQQSTPDGSPLAFWRPKLVTMHVWLWYHNPAGLYHPTNPLVSG